MSSKGPLTITADVRLNNYEVEPTNVHVRQQIAFVAQDDSLQITATPREAIRFSAKLRLPRSMTDEEIDKLTERMLQELGLLQCADTIVGGALLKGISGGERKRTSVGVELVVKPALVFLDEPTSGLDSFSAMQLVKVLKKVATAGASVLFTIHQPSSDVFNSFDQLILMNGGEVMGSGSIDEMETFFAERGHPVPNHYNPADWMMVRSWLDVCFIIIKLRAHWKCLPLFISKDVAQTVSKDELVVSGFFPEDQRSVGTALQTSKSDAVDILGRTIVGTMFEQATNGKPADQRHVSFGTQVAILLEREWKNIVRNKTVLAARYMYTTMMSFLVGVIFWDVGSRSLQNFAVRIIYACRYLNILSDQSLVCSSHPS